MALRMTGVLACDAYSPAASHSIPSLLPAAANTMYQFKFQIPSYYTLLVRSLSVLEVWKMHSMVGGTGT